MKVIFVAETVPSRNKGEAALMHGIVSSIKEYCDEDILFYLCSEMQSIDQKEYGNEVKVLDHKGLIPINDTVINKLRFFLFRSVKHFFFLILYRMVGGLSLNLFTDEIWRAYSCSDVIIIGHDNLFCKFHIPLIVFLKLLGKKVVVYGCTITPVVLSSKFINVLAKHALNRVDLITTRESLTYDLLKSIGVNKAPLFCTADKGFILDPISTHQAHELKKKFFIDDLPKPVIGVMVVKGSTVYKAAFKGNKYTQEEKYQKHSQEIANALDGVNSKIGGTFVFIPHCIGPGVESDDRLCAITVRSLMENKDSVVLLEEELRVNELKGMMATFDLVVSERTHGGINAATMFVPTLWITHPKDHRTYGIVSDTLELPECLYNIEDLNSKSLEDKIVDTYNNKVDIVKTLKVTIPKAKKAAMLNGEYFRKYVLDI